MVKTKNKSGKAGKRESGNVAVAVDERLGKTAYDAYHLLSGLREKKLPWERLTTAVKLPWMIAAKSVVEASQRHGPLPSILSSKGARKKTGRHLTPALSPFRKSRNAERGNGVAASGQSAIVNRKS